MIATWWAGLSLFMQIIWGVTIAATLTFIIQSIMTFIGADAGDAGGFDAAFDDPGDLGGIDSGMNLYTFRNLVNFALGFGWTVIIFEGSIRSKALLISLAILIGILLVVAVMFLFKWLSSMQQSGNVDVYRSAKGCTGTVYLTIPAEKQGEGKVQITISNAIREFYAMTEGEKLENGTPIKVVDVINAQTLLVKKDDSNTI